MNLYNIVSPSEKPVAILISVPHCGTDFPDELVDHYDPELIKAPDDTDWYVDKLYDFAPAMGITMITAKYSRWVIDLNRDPGSKPLYNDGRIITDLCPTSTFAGEPIYKEGHMPDGKEIERRLEKYYWPYYYKIQELLNEMKEKLGRVLFWDAHSIRQHVPMIRKEIFPDLILGDNNGQTADVSLIECALTALSKKRLKLEHNHPFRGGHLTRYFGKPKENQHALQLEMSKINYMDNREINYGSERAAVIRDLLKTNFTSLIAQLEMLK